jgi:hypothetical protein
MGSAENYSKEKLVIAVLSSDVRLENELDRVLERYFGPIDYKSEKIDFTFTSYYNVEMGTPIIRFFLSFENPVAPDHLAAIKKTTNEIEAKFSTQGKRVVNLDPGLLALSRFILASTKNSSHRIPLRDGIYAEIELMFERGSFRAVEWTYADFRSEPYIRILNEIREIYKKNMAE